MATDPRYVLAMQAIQDEIASGRLQLDRDIYQNIQLPTSYGNLTGFIPSGYPGYAGLPTFGALTGAAGMFGLAGTDPRWAQLGYQSGQPLYGPLAQNAGLFGTTGTSPAWQQFGYAPGTETLPTRQLAGGEAERDTRLGMEFGGGTYVGGQLAPDWLQPFAAQAQAWSRSHGGIAPTQAQLTELVSGNVNQALEGLRADPTYQAGDGALRRRLEAQAVAGATGTTPQNALNIVNDLRQQSANRGGAASTPQDILEAVGRWSGQNPADRVGAVNQAMTRLREDPAYQAAGGEGRRQLEARAISQAVPELDAARARSVVDELRAGSAGTAGLSANEAVKAVLDRAVGAPTPPSYGGQPPQPLYGQGQRPTGPMARGGPFMVQEPGLGPGGVAVDNPMVQYQRTQQGLAGMGNAGYGGMGAAGALGAIGLGGVRGIGGGLNYGGSGLAGGDYGAAMSPEQRRLVEQGRQFDVSTQLGQRAQDIALRGQDISQQGQFGDLALRALQQESQLRADPFQLARYRYGLGQTGIPNVINAVAGSGVLPGVQGGQGPVPQRPTLGNQIGQATGYPTFGAPMAGIEQQVQAAGPLSQINARNYLRAGQGGQQYVNSLYRYSGEAQDDQDVQEAVRRALPQFARRGVPTFGRVA